MWWGVLAVVSEHLFGSGCVTLCPYRLVGRFPNTTRGLPRLGGAMYVYMTDGWFHSFGVLGFWLVVVFGVCGGQACWLLRWGGCLSAFYACLGGHRDDDVVIQ